MTVASRTKTERWAAVPAEDWHDWRWQLRNRLSKVEDLAQLISLTDDEVSALRLGERFRVELTPFVISLIDGADANCPIRRQVLPAMAETHRFPGEQVDSVAEDADTPVRGIVHRYPDRVLMLVTTQCASYCRFCTRSRIVGNPAETFGPQDFERQIEYIAAHREIRDVLLSGGDPLLLTDQVLSRLLGALRQVEHVEIIRFSTRIPLFLPQRITPELLRVLQPHQPLWINVHFNHPKELAPDVEAALARLADAGIPLGGHTVLMAGINDCSNIMLALMHRLVRNRVRPYYLYQCDLVRGAGHFRTPVAKGIEIVEALRGHTSGYAVPQYVIDAPGGGGKVPFAPNYALSMSERTVVMRNFEGLISTYVQPENYASHDRSRCTFCLESEERAGVSGLLERGKGALRPSGWRPRRGGEKAAE